jgi:hypothetical protein
MDAFSAAALALDAYSVASWNWALPSSWVSAGAVTPDGRPKSEVEAEDAGMARRISDAPNTIPTIIAGSTATAEHPNSSQVTRYATPTLTGDTHSSFVRGGGSPEARNCTPPRPADGRDRLGGIDGVFLVDPEYKVAVNVSG